MAPLFDAKKLGLKAGQHAATYPIRCAHHELFEMLEEVYTGSMIDLEYEADVVNEWAALFRKTAMDEWERVCISLTGLDKKPS